MSASSSAPVISRERVRNEFGIRTLTVRDIRDLGPRMRRVTLEGPMEGFSSQGPGDHVKVFFPDPETGELHAPRLTAEGMKRPEGVPIHGRDYTPLPREDGALDLDFVLHGDDGPASHWAARVAIGDQLVVAGPRGSALPPTGVDGYVIGGDETALPAISRWLEIIDPEVPVIAIIEVTDAADESYPLASGANRDIRWLHRGDAAPGSTDLLAEAVLALPETDGVIFHWFGGESISLIPVRRHLRRELGFDKSAVDVSGYWRRDTVAHDHHAPVDPDDPED